VINRVLYVCLACLLVLFASQGFTQTTPAPKSVKLSDAQVEDIVRRSYQYVAMFNVNNKFALKQGGWNTVEADTKLKDHTMSEKLRGPTTTRSTSAVCWTCARTR